MNDNEKLKQAALLSQERWISSFENNLKSKNTTVSLENSRFNKKLLKNILLVAIVSTFLFITITTIATLNNQEMTKKSGDTNDYIVASDINKDFEENLKNKKMIEIKLEYIPDGFMCSNKEAGKYFTEKVFSNGEKYFRVQEYLFFDSNFDAENYECIYNKDGELHYQKNDEYKIILSKNKKIYIFVGNLSYEEMKKIAKSLK